MSRIGKMPVSIPDKVNVTIRGDEVEVKGPLGTLSRTFCGVKLSKGKDHVKVEPAMNKRTASAYWGLGRTLLSNMVQGVSEGFKRKLQIQGIGYRAETKPGAVVLTVGYSHPITYELPERVSAEFDAKQNILTLSSIDKELLGRVAAEIRKVRPPDSYKGKGIRYLGEVVRRKEGKTG
jgi:large subunit ribosomal protein L6